jgi:hypothetical protein
MTINLKELMKFFEDKECSNPLIELFIKRTTEKYHRNKKSGDSPSSVSTLDKWYGWLVKRNDFASIVDRGLDWGCTPEGHNFWSEVYSQECKAITSICYEYKLK